MGVWIFSGTAHSVKNSKRTIFKLKQDRECLKHSTENIQLNSNKNFPWKQMNRSLIFDKKTLVFLRILTENYEKLGDLMRLKQTVRHFESMLLRARFPS